MSSKKRKRENNSKWSAAKLKCSACDVVKETPGPQLDSHLVKNELEAFLLYINKNINKIVERTNVKMHKVLKKINADEFLFHFSVTNEEEIKCLFGLVYFRGLHYDTKQPKKSSGTVSARKIYKTAMSLNRYEWLMRPITFHDHNTVRADFLKGSFASLRWIFTEFGKNTRQYYWHTEFVVTDEI